MEDYEDNEYELLPPVTIEDAEDQLVSLAFGLAKQRLQDGSASNQLIAEILRMGTAKEKLQKEKLRKENELLRAKTESLKSQKTTEEFYSRVLNSLHSYGPQYYTTDEDEEYEL